MVEKALARMTEEFIAFGLTLCKDAGRNYEVSEK
jgi:hypothetical protein